MNSQLEELRKWTEELTKSTWEGVFQMVNLFQQSPAPKNDPAAGELFSQIIEMNRLTLSTLEQYRHWQKITESLKQYSEQWLGNSNQHENDRYRQLEKQVEALGKKLTDQEKLIRELQSRLQSQENPQDDQTAQILSEFLSNQTEQIKRLFQPANQ